MDGVNPTAQPTTQPNPTPTPLSPSGNGQTPLLIIFFVLLLVIIGGTVAYYYLNLKQNYQPSSSSSSPPPQTTTITPSPTPNHLQAIDSNVINGLKVFKKGVLSSAVLQTENKGVITELNTKGGTTNDGTYSFALSFELQGDGAAKNGFFYTAQELNVMTIRKGGKIIKPSELAVGDLLSVKQTTNLLGDVTNSTTQVIIEVLNKNP